MSASLRLRITAWYVSLLAVIIAALGCAARRSCGAGRDCAGRLVAGAPLPAADRSDHRHRRGDRGRPADRASPVWPSNDEVAHLARTFNTMLDRIQHGVDEQRRLVADTSHELRTPLAAMRPELDVSLHADELSPAARTVLLSAREEVDRMSRTVADLLTLAAADDGVLQIDDEPLDLAALAATVADRLAPVAPASRSRARGRR